MNKYFVILHRHHHRTGEKISTQIIYVEEDTKEKAIDIAWKAHGGDACHLRECFEVSSTDSYIVCN